MCVWMQVCVGGGRCESLRIVCLFPHAGQLAVRSCVCEVVCVWSLYPSYCPHKWGPAEPSLIAHTYTHVLSLSLTPSPSLPSSLLLTLSRARTHTHTFMQWRLTRASGVPVLKNIGPILITLVESWVRVRVFERESTKRARAPERG